MAKELLIFCLVSSVLVSCRMCQRNVSRQQSYCTRPENIVKVRLHEFQGTWYFVRTVNYQDQVYNAKCIRGQFGIPPDGWRGVASWVSKSLSNDVYRNDLYEIWQSEPGMVDFQGVGNVSVSATYYILKFVPQDRALISVCYKRNGTYLDQIYSYYVFGSPQVDKAVMDKDYSDAGIVIRNSMTIVHDAECFKQ